MLIFLRTPSLAASPASQRSLAGPQKSGVHKDIYIYIYIYNIKYNSILGKRDSIHFYDLLLLTPNLPTKSLGFEGFDSSRLLILRDAEVGSSQIVIHVYILCMCYYIIYLCFYCTCIMYVFCIKSVPRLYSGGTNRLFMYLL